MNQNRLGSLAKGLLCLATAFVAAEARGQYGPILSGAGPVNRSFGGVATAAPLGAAGALYWTPATMGGLPRSELEGGAELLFPRNTASSELAPGSLGPGVPPVRLSGRSTSDSTVFALPTLAVAYLPEDSPFVYGLGIFSLAGFGVDFPGSTSNPLFTAPPPAGLGFGPVHSEFQALQIVPALTYRATNRVSVAAGPTLTLAPLRVEPGLFAAPDDANGDGFATSPAATHARTVVGGGFTVGVYYQADGWAVGASLKSPQWLDTFRFNARDERGRPRDLAFHVDGPTIVSVGGAYTGLEGWTFGLDVRYIDFANTSGLEDRGFTPDGAVRGLGWRSIFAVAVGAQYRVGDKLAVRAGYSWNQSPIPDGVSFINTVAPTIVEHTVYAGLSWNVTEDFALSIAYLHAFENAIA